MDSWHHERLSAEQAARISEWFPDIRVLSDMSWNLVDTVVLDVDSGGHRYVIKAAGPSNHHIGREIDAHLTATAALASIGRAARMVHYDRSVNLLVTEYLDGTLALGTESEFDSEIFRQAGEVLRTFHSQSERLDGNAVRDAISASVAWLNKPNRIRAETSDELRKILASHRLWPTQVVPTHGDWHPRNWLVDFGTVKAIDFGRFAFRPASSDFCRLAAQQWRRAPGLEAAFLDGYGDDPREPGLWRIISLREAIGTAVWAYQVGDEPFEQQGLRMIDDALRLF